jgi:uncharacterized protein YydD (DUF2326 family)
MIYRIFSSTLDSFKTQVFHPGCNLVVAEKTFGATEHQTRNCAGKSSLIEIVNYALGADVDKSSIFRIEALKPHAFGIAFDLDGDKTIIERSESFPSRVSFLQANTSDWPHEAETEKARRFMRIKEWRQVLGSLIFDLPVEQQTYSPTFRLLFPYLARSRRVTAKGSDDGFLDARRHSVKMQAWQQQVALAWFLDLDWRVGSAFEEVRLKENALKALKKEFKAGVFQSIIGTAAQLRSRQTLLEKRVGRLQTEMKTFQVLPEYHELEKEASLIANRLSSLANANSQDEETLHILQSAIADERPPAESDILRVYHEAGTVLADGVQKRLEDLRRFHEAVIRNRTLHLQADIDAIDRRLVNRREEMAIIDARRREIMDVLSSHGALEQYTSLQGEMNLLTAELEQVRRHRDLADRIESSKTDLAVEKATLQKRLQSDIRQRELQIQDAVVLFEEYSRNLCEYEGTLTVSSSENGLELDIQVPGYRGKGLAQMQIFCFDLMLSVLLTKRGLGPGFLIHDSHLFDGMDSRQTGAALKLASETADAYGFQYIATLNSDTLEHEDLREVFDPTLHIVPNGISDATQVGGLFGFRFD